MHYLLSQLNYERIDYYRVPSEGLPLPCQITALMESRVVKKKELNAFLRENRQELADFAIKTPVAWIEFSHAMRSHLKKHSKLFKLLNKLDRIIGLKFKHLYPGSVRQNIARLYPARLYDNTKSLLKMRALLTGDYRSLKAATKIRDIPLSDLADWIDHHEVPLATLRLYPDELEYVVPKLRFVDLSYYPEDSISFLLSLMSKVSHLTCKWLNDEDLAQLQAFPYLTSLDLIGSNITDRGVKKICKLPNLTRLNVSGCINLTDYALKCLGSVNTLTSLNISGCIKISYVGFKYLLKCQDLEKLEVAGCNIGSMELNVIRTFVSLKFLNLASSCGNNVPSLVHSNQLIHLEELDLSFLNMDELGVMSLCEFEKLKIVNLTGCRKMTDRAVQSLCSQALVSLNLKGCSRITDWAFRYPRIMLKTLKVLDISGCYEISDAGLLRMTQFTEITHLTMRGCNQVSNAGIEYLRKLPKLKYLNLQLCIRITETVEHYFTGVDILL